MTPSRILIVEDESIVALDLQGRLAQLGYQAAGLADTGEQSLILTEQLRPDLVLMDIRLAGAMDGIAAALEIRRRFRTPVVYLTAYSEDDTLQRAKITEPFGYILKPFEDRELKTTIEMALYKHQAEEEIRRLSRLLSLLSQVNQAIVRCTSRESLFPQICQIAIEYGGFQAAVLGWYDRQAQTIQPLSHAGEPRALPAPCLTCSTLPVEPLGPLGAALQDGRLYACNHLDQAAQAALGLAAEGGSLVRSLAAVPFRFQGEVCGLLCLFAGETGFFEAAENELLEEVAMDISHALDMLEERVQRARADEALREREARYRAVIETSPDGFWMADAEGRILEINDALARRSGYSRPELLALRVNDLEARESAGEIAAHMEKIKRQGSDIFETLLRAKDGPVWPAEVDAAYWPISGGRTFAFIRDITERKELERRQTTAIEVLNTLNRFTNLSRTIQDLLAIIKRQTGLEAVGIRLREGEDFPYYVQNGFPPDFVQAENRLCSLAPDGTMRRDALGQSVPECGCGLVLSGRTDPANPLFTTGGSFWCNDTTRLLNLSKDEDPRLHPRNRCVSKGYKSVALIPIRVDQEVVGLLQLNDHRANCFTLEMIRFFEGIATSVGSAVARTRAEEAMRHSEERYRHLVETTFDWVWEVDAQGRYTYASPKVRDLLGYAPEEVVGRTPFDLMPEAEARRVKAIFDEISAARRPFVALENTNRHRDGRLVVLETSGMPVLTPEGLLAGYRGMDRDITERKQAMEALRASEERLRLALEAARMGTWERNLKTSRLAWSPALEEMNGYEPGTFPGTDDAFMALLHPDCHAMHAAAQQRVRGQDGVFQVELHYRLRDGRERWGLVLGRILHDPDGRPDRLVGVELDITDRKRLEERLRQAQKLEAIGQLAGGVAHDFNNILAAMMMNLGLLQENPQLDPETQQSLKELETEAKRAASLTRQLLMFSRRSVLEIKVLDLNEVVANLLKMLGRLIGEDVKLQFHPESALPLIEGDAGMLEQVLMNLSVNARDAMPKGGPLTIATAAVTVNKEQAGAEPDRQPGPFVCLSVTDTGCGMNDATLKRIFEPFFTTKEPGKGTGLGLATVYGLVAQHKGWVEVESQVGQGTTFRVFLPVTDKAAGGAPDAAKPPVLSRGHEAILLVEDDPAVRRVVAQNLRVLGYQVFEAGNGQEAVDLWGRHGHQIDLLFTDMVMPEGMTGLELAQTLLKGNPRLKVVISSGYSAEFTQQGKPTDEGIVYLPKPYQASLLGKTLRDCLDR